MKRREKDIVAKMREREKPEQRWDEVREREKRERKRQVGISYEERRWDEEKEDEMKKGKRQ